MLKQFAKISICQIYRRDFKLEMLYNTLMYILSGFEVWKMHRMLVEDISKVRRI
jgi:hypothetical protein